MESLEKFNWKLEYCEERNIPASKKWAWDEAEKKYEEYINRDKGE